jgi:hypothetical protein
MEPLFKILLENGIMGAVACAGIFLFLKERKINQDSMATNFRQQIEDTANKVKLTTALEDLAATVETIDDNIREDISNVHGRLEEIATQATNIRSDMREAYVRDEERSRKYEIPKGGS